MQLKKLLCVLGTCSFTLLLATSSWADEAAMQRTLISQQSQINQLQRDIATLRGELEQLRYLITRQNAQPVYGYAPAPGYTNQQQQGVVGYQAAPAQAGQVPAAANTNNANIVDIPVGVPSNGAAPAPAAEPSIGVKAPSTAGPVTPLGNDNLHYYNNPSAQPQPQANANQAPAPAQGPVLERASDEARGQYNQAYAKVQSNDLKGAQAAFQSYVEKYPNNSLTPNAWYWLGQVQYVQGLYDQSRISFLNVARYTDSQKRPDALYKLGMVSKFLGDKDKAKRYFQLVIQSYPNNTASNLANNELQRM